jgi:hypothetical protein
MVTVEANEGPVALHVEVTIFVNLLREPGHEAIARQLCDVHHLPSVAPDFKPDS